MAAKKDKYGNLIEPEMPGTVDKSAVTTAKQGYNSAKSALDNMSYDNFKQGSMYQGLQKSYAQQGQQAMKDTLGQVAARTGGMASSYAATAGQQSYNNYMQQLEDVARSMYNDEYSKARDKVDLAQSEYDRLYGEKRDEILDKRYDDEWAYQKGRDEITDQRYLTDKEEERVKNAAYYGNAPDYATYKANGGTLSERDYNSLVAIGEGMSADAHYEQNLTNKATRDTELKGIFGADDFLWGDWDGDGKVEGNKESKTFEDVYGGSSYGEDYWKAYAENAAKGYADEKNGKMAEDFQEFIDSGMNFEEAVRRIGGVYNSNYDQIKLRDGTLISPQELTGHTAEYWITLHRALTAEKEPEVKGVSGTDFTTYYDYFSDVAPGDEASAQDMVDAIIAATGNEDLAFSLYGLWQSQTGEG